MKTPFAVIREKEKLAAIDARICTPICQGTHHPCHVLAPTRASEFVGGLSSVEATENNE